MFNVKTVMETLRIIDQNFPKPMEDRYEEIDIIQGLSRVLYEDVISQENVPAFNRSSVDGYGLISKDTIGCSEALPALLDIIGQVEMGQSFDKRVLPGQCAYVPTGGMIPEGSDSVAMIEYSESFDEQTIGITKPSAPGENIIYKGEDIKQGNILLKQGTLVRPQDIGALAAIGITKVKVYKKVKVAVISTGNEIIDPNKEIKMGQIRDINTYTISSSVIRDGAQVVLRDRCEDDREKIEGLIKRAMDIADVVFISGGSSVGIKDMTGEIIDSLGEPGVLVHGISAKPGKPTIVANVGGKAVVGLPGHPVSALVIYNVIGKKIINNLMGLYQTEPSYFVGVFERNYPKAAGREEYIMVETFDDKGQTYIRPIYGKSGLITTMTRAIGYVKVDVNKEGINQGEMVKVIPFF